MRLVAFHLREDALTWFISWIKEIDKPSWPQSAAAVSRQFGPCLRHIYLDDLNNTVRSEYLEANTNQFNWTKFQVLFLTPGDNQFLDLNDQKIQISLHAMTGIMNSQTKPLHLSIKEKIFSITGLWFNT